MCAELKLEVRRSSGLREKMYRVTELDLIDSLSVEIKDHEKYFKPGNGLQSMLLSIPYRMD